MSAATHSARPLHLLSLLLCLLSTATADDLQLLLSIKSTLDNPNTAIFNSWVPTNRITNFTGITCNPDNSVKEIDLSNQQFTSTVPFDSICQLKSLEKLSLGRNSLHGIVSENLRSCVKLQYLDLGNNLFTGSIPDISPLSGLKYLYLNHSGFSGKFPWNSLWNMTGLVVLSIGDNPFEQVPFPDVVGELTELTWLYLSNANLEGPACSRTDKESKWRCLGHARRRASRRCKKACLEGQEVAEKSQVQPPSGRLPCSVRTPICPSKMKLLIGTVRTPPLLRPDS